MKQSIIAVSVILIGTIISAANSKLITPISLFWQLTTILSLIAWQRESYKKKTIINDIRVDSSMSKEMVREVLEEIFKKNDLIISKSK